MRATALVGYRCSAIDFILLFGFTVVAGLMSGLGMLIVKRDHQEKFQCGYPFQQEDYIPKAKSMFIISGVGLASGLLCGTFGLSPEYILSPAILSLNIGPVVARHTVLFITIATTLAITICNYY